MTDLMNRQSHIMFIDKKICEATVDLDANGHYKNGQKIDFDHCKDLKVYDQAEGLIITDFDTFIPKNNPIVNFPTIEVKPPPKSKK